MATTSCSDRLPNRECRGFSLTEMLVTLLILVMASTLMATGIPIAFDTYQKTVRTSNAQVALSTTITALKSELGVAREITNEITDDGNRMHYRSSEGYLASIGNSDNLDKCHGLNKTYYTQDGTVVYNYGLVSNKAITDDLRVTYEEIGKDPDLDEVYIKNLRVYYKDEPDNSLASVPEYLILTRCD